MQKQSVTTKNVMQMETILPGGCSKGELTWHGQAQSRNLGKWLRDRYVEDLSLIPSTFQVSEFINLLLSLAAPLCGQFMLWLSAFLLT